jgi:hypothetical protein
MITMKPLIAASLLLLLGAGCAKPIPAPAPVPPPEPSAPAKRTYHDETHGFTLAYSEEFRLLTDKEKMGTSGYIPVCDPLTAVVCLLLPRETYPGTNFQGAGFAVNVLADKKTEADCLKPEGNMRFIGDEWFAGVTYKSFADGDAATSHRSEGSDLLTFRDGTCFSLTKRVATSVFEVYEPGTIKRYADEDDRQVQLKLETALEDLRFE